MIIKYSSFIYHPKLVQIAIKFILNHPHTFNINSTLNFQYKARFKILDIKDVWVIFVFLHFPKLIFVTVIFVAEDASIDGRTAILDIKYISVEHIPDNEVLIRHP